MTDQQNSSQPDWLDEFEELANARLDQGSSCNQIHPIIAAWYKEVMAGEPPLSRNSVWQALHCLTTELLNNVPPFLSDMLAEHNTEEEFAEWVTEVILVGRAFQMALDSGRLDDL
jgi:hypothetical protein